MAKHKQARRAKAIAMAMAASLAMGTITAFADTVTNPDGSTTTTDVIQSGEGTSESPEITMTITVHQKTDGSVSKTTEEVSEYTEENEEGSTDVVETETIVDQDNADGSTLDSTVNRTETTKKDSHGNKISESYVEEGEETEIWTEEDDGKEKGQQKIEIELIPGEKTSSTVNKEQIVEGDTPEGENDNEFDYTTTDTVDRTVTAETSSSKVEINETEAELESVKPVYNPNSKDEMYSDSGHFGITDGTTWKAIMNELVNMKNAGEITEEQYNALVKSSDNSDYVDGTITYNKDGSVNDAKKNDAKNFYEMMEDPIMLKAINKVLGEDKAANASDADYCFVGSGNYSSQWVSKVYVTYMKDENTDKPLVDENGDYIVESITLSNGTDITVGGVPVTELTPEYIESLGGDLSGVYDQKTGTRASQFMLMDKDGNIIFTHCIDIETSATKGKWYRISNLEENDYYASEEAEEHVRSIVMNGYWGTSDVAKEDGTYETGSLSKVKHDLMEAVKNGDAPDTVTISYKQDGEIVTEDIKITEELLAGFTPGEATDVMQAAIWSYANGAQSIQDGKDGWCVGGAYYGDTANGQSNNHAALENDPAGMARMKLFYDWLVGLETEEEATTVINEKTFGKASLVIGDKIESSDDGKSDTYEASLNFKAEFEVGEEDELYVNLTYIDLEGEKHEIRRQLGRAGEEATEGMIVPNEDSSYTLANLALTENEEFTFDLRLEGVQQLKQSAYIFVADGGVKDSQTFVGMAEGTNTVDISTSVRVKFDVNEDDVVKKVRKWRDEGRIRFDDDDEEEKTPPTKPETPPTVDIFEDDPPLADAPEEEIFEIPEEDVILADAPMTGDPTSALMGVSFFSALGLLLSGRRKKED